MYSELGGYPGYHKTPVKELIECRLSIVAEWNIQAEQNEKIKQKQEEQERELEKQKTRGR